MKGVKKDEQYRILWNELETVIGTSGKSSGHKQLIACIRECRASSPLDSVTSASVPMPKITEIIDVDDPTPVVPSIRASVIRTTTDSPLSPPITDSRTKRINFASGGAGTRSLLDIVVAAERVQTQKRLDFSGRLCTPAGQIAKLYPGLQTKEAAAAAAAEPVKIGS